MFLGDSITAGGVRKDGYVTLDANAIAKRILNGTSNAPQDHINFLKAGSSQAPIDLYKFAGVDMTSTQPIADAFEVLENYIDRLEELTNK